MKAHAIAIALFSPSDEPLHARYLSKVGGLDTPLRRSGARSDGTPLPRRASDERVLSEQHDHHNHKLLLVCFLLVACACCLLLVCLLLVRKVLCCVAPHKTDEHWTKPESPSEHDHRVLVGQRLLACSRKQRSCRSRCCFCCC